MGTFSIPEWGFPIYELPSEVAAAWTERESMGWVGLTFAEMLDLFFHVRSVNVLTKGLPHAFVHEYEWYSDEYTEADPGSYPEGGLYNLAGMYAVDSAVKAEPFPITSPSANEAALFEQVASKRSFSGVSPAESGVIHTETVNVTFGVQYEANEYNVLVLGTWDNDTLSWVDQAFYTGAINGILKCDGLYWFLVHAQIDYVVDPSLSPQLDADHPNGPYLHNVGPTGYQIFPNSGLSTDTQITTAPLQPGDPQVSVDFLGKTINLRVFTANPVDFTAGAPVVTPGQCFPHNPHDGDGPIWEADCASYSSEDFFGKIVPTAGPTPVWPPRSLRNPLSWQP